MDLRVESPEVNTHNRELLQVVNVDVVEGGARVGGGGGGGDSVVAHVPDKIVDNGIPSTSHCGFLSLARSQ